MFQRERSRLSGSVAGADTQSGHLDSRGRRHSANGHPCRTGRTGQTARLLDVTFFIYVTADADGLRHLLRADRRRSRPALSGGTLATDRCIGRTERANAQCVMPPSTCPPAWPTTKRSSGLRGRNPLSFWSLPAQISRIESGGIFLHGLSPCRLDQLLATPADVRGHVDPGGGVFAADLCGLGDLAKMSTPRRWCWGSASSSSIRRLRLLVPQKSFPPWLAAWLPPLMTALAAFTLLFYTEDG